MYFWSFTLLCLCFATLKSLYCHCLLANILPYTYYTILFLKSFSVSFSSPSPVGNGGINSSAYSYNGLYELVGSLTSGLQSQEGSLRDQATIGDKWWGLLYCASQAVDCGTIQTPVTTHTYTYVILRTPIPQPVANQVFPWESHWQWLEIKINNAGQCWVVWGGMSFVCVCII